MSKFTETATASHTLSLAMLEEASRFGRRSADIEHLFLALVVDAQAAGQVLRSLGITLDAAREAVATQHAEQIASLGIRVDAPAQGRIVFHETGGYELGELPTAIFKRASQGEKRGNSTAVLRELLSEPSGMIEDVLQRLGTSPAAVADRLDEVERYPSHPSSRALEPGKLAGTVETFAAAPLERVWAMLADPTRMPEWEPNIGTIEISYPQSRARAGDTWTTRALTQRPDGKPIRIKPEFQAQLVELVTCEENRVIEWRFTFPAAEQANSKRVAIELEPAAGGTQLRVSLAWEHHPSRTRRPLLALFMRPIARFATWMQLSQLAGGISRAFR